MSKDDWDETGAPNRPQTADEVRQARLAELTESPAEVTSVPPPYIDPAPAAGTANVRIPPGFRSVHALDLTTQFGVVITQTAWTNVPQNQVTEIQQIASENQVLLEVQEPS